MQGAFYDVSLGLMIDGDDRLWAINTSSRLFVLTIDKASADKTAL